MVSIQDLQAGISQLSDEALLHRWGNNMFTEEAMPIAEREIQTRGLRHGQEDILLSDARQVEELHESRQIKYVHGLRVVNALAGAFGGFVSLGLTGAFFGAMIGWYIGILVAKLANRLTTNIFVRLIVGAVSFIAVLFFIGAVGTFIALTLAAVRA